MTTRQPFQTRYANPSAILDPDIAIGDVIVCDISASMDEKSFEPTKTKRHVMHEALVSYLDIKRTHRPQDYVAIIAYETTATVCCPLLNIRCHSDQIRTALHRMEHLPVGDTSMKTGLRKVMGLVREDIGYGLLRNGIVRCLAYSDGYDSSTWAALWCARKLRRIGVLIETFGVGRDPTEVDEGFLRGIASSEDNFVHYRFLGDGDAVRETFLALANGGLTFDGSITPWTNTKR